MSRPAAGPPLERTGAAGDPASEPRAPISCERALELILEGARPLGPEWLPLEAADERACAREVRARRSLPPWDNSAKDGYAVASQDLASLPDTADEREICLPVGGEIAAGAAPGAVLAPGTTLRIMTGAPLPEGADAVVPVEDGTAPEGRGRFAPVGTAVRFSRRAGPRANVRPAGGDVTSGQVVIRPGDALTPGRIALLAALGEGQIEVHHRPRVVLLPTGDELVEPGEEAPPGKLYSSNAHGLAAFVRRAGGVPRIGPIVPDDRPRIRSAVFEALAEAEVLVASGGVSAGAHDHVRGVLAEAAGGIVFWKVLMRPGEPLVFTRVPEHSRAGGVQTRYLFGLPGNPTSALVTFLEFVRPLLRRLAGFGDLFLPTVPATLSEHVRTEPGRRSFVRVRLSRDAKGGFVATPSGGQGSGLLRPFADADGLLVAGPERTDLPTGSVESVQLLDLPAGPPTPYGS
jgi:molybdopterin molybdotransferase